MSARRSLVNEPHSPPLKTSRAAMMSADQNWANIATNMATKNMKQVGICTFCLCPPFALSACCNGIAFKFLVVVVFADEDKGLLDYIN